MAIKKFIVKTVINKTIIIDTDVFMATALGNNMLDGYADDFDAENNEALLEFLAIDYVEAAYTSDDLVGEVHDHPLGISFNDTSYEVTD
jgi:hypothetical protein